MKKLLSVLLALSMVFALAGCGTLDLSGRDPVGSDGDEDPIVTPDEEGYAAGFIGDTLRTTFFDMTVNEAYSCYEFDGLTADEGMMFLVAELTLFNYTKTSQPMYFTDFEVWWGSTDDEESWDFPVYEEVQLEDGTYDYLNLSEQQLPTEYDLTIQETRTGILLYQVPETEKDFDITFYEYFEDESYGDIFQIRFSAPAPQE